MIRERFRTSHNVFGNNTTEESEADSSPFNIRLLNTTQEFYSPSEHFNMYRQQHKQKRIILKALQIKQVHLELYSILKMRHHIK